MSPNGIHNFVLQWLANLLEAPAETSTLSSWQKFSWVASLETTYIKNILEACKSSDADCKLFTTYYLNIKHDMENA